MTPKRIRSPRDFGNSSRVSAALAALSCAVVMACSSDESPTPASPLAAAGAAGTSPMTAAGGATAGSGSETPTAGTGAVTRSEPDAASGATSIAGSNDAGGGAGRGALDAGGFGGSVTATGGSSGKAGTGGSSGTSAGTAGGVSLPPNPTGGTAAWNAPGNGNPFLPGYFADPSVFYDADSKTFYVFATTDGNWIDYSSEPTVWYSTDFVHWKAQPLTVPAFWPKQPMWAPTVMKNPKNGQYYLAYGIGGSGSGTYVAKAASPLGPFQNATAGNAPLYRKGEMFGNNDWFDAQFFVDDDGSAYMTFGGGGNCGVMRLAFAADGTVSIDNSDARMTNGALHKFKQLTGLSSYLEGSVMFKNGSQYFIAYSNSACQNYNVQFATASSPVGPWSHMNGTIVRRDDAKSVLGPGHNSMLHYGNDWYIVYHRQHFPYVDVKRQVAINRVTLSGNSISANAQTQEGVFAGMGSLETFARIGRAQAEPDLAFGKAVLASTESDFKGGTSGNQVENFPVRRNFYAGRYAVDHNYGTRWAPTTLPGSLIVDLGADTAIGRCETTFEYVLRSYRYRIDWLSQAEAASLDAARASTVWHLYADRSANTTRVSPIVDAAPASARYLRLTVTSADIPRASAETRTIVETDYADRVSVTEFKVFKNPAAP